MECMDLNDLSVVARDHAVHPRHYGPLQKFDGHSRITGLCGDTMEFWIQVRNLIIHKISFITDGCGPSLAAGSMIATLAGNKTLNEISVMRPEEAIEALGGLPAEYEHCALLAANTLKAACTDYMSRHHNETKSVERSGGTCDSCSDKDCSASKRRNDENDEEFNDRRKLESRLCKIGKKIVVLSGKGGVGKSTVAVNLASSLMLSGKRVGLLDVDIHGPSIPTMLGLAGEMLQASEEGILPIELGDLKVMSIGFMLKNQDEAIIWRGPMKMGVIKQFLKDVIWGDLDYLIIDSPPGTGDEPLSVCQLIENLDGAVVVTTPQKVAAVDVRKSITFCRQLKVPVLGIVENMAGFICPKCGEITEIFSSGGGKQIAEDMGVPFLGSIPMDPAIAEACDSGRVFIHSDPDSVTAKIMRKIVGPLTMS